MEFMLWVQGPDGASGEHAVARFLLCAVGIPSGLSGTAEGSLPPEDLPYDFTPLK